MFLCTLEQSRHMYTPNVTLDHVGFRAWQSKQVCGARKQGYGEKGPCAAYFVSLLGFEHFKYLLCLLFRWVAHRSGWKSSVDGGSLWTKCDSRHTIPSAFWQFFSETDSD
jgi:hypothetical protein